MSLLKTVMAKRCKHCPLCAYARAKPETLIGKAMAFHGRFCPFWKAYVEIYGEGQAPETHEGDEASA
ncbi:MAG: hypothetical protein KAI47_13145 [Deltaproteobacteria bacterium]|nr:hypothetical protein [Deltaproteobacteria bacterium]